MTQEEGAKVKNNRLLDTMTDASVLASQSMGSGNKKGKGKCLCLKRLMTAAYGNFNV